MYEVNEKIMQEDYILEQDGSFYYMTGPEEIGKGFFGYQSVNRLDDESRFNGFIKEKYDVLKFTNLLTVEERKSLIAESCLDDPFLGRFMCELGYFSQFSQDIISNTVINASEAQLNEMISKMRFTQRLNQYLGYMLDEWVEETFDTLEERNNYRYMSKADILQKLEVIREDFKNRVCEIRNLHTEELEKASLDDKLMSIQALNVAIDTIKIIGKTYAKG